MLSLRSNRASKTHVNILKKVRVNGQWKFCPAVIERNGRLKNRVQVNGHTEVHPEGVYYLEWRHQGRRCRQAVPNQHEVLQQARLKMLELEAAKVALRQPQLSTGVSIRLAQRVMPGRVDTGKATGAVLQGFESYLQAFIAAAVRAQLAQLGSAGVDVVPSSGYALPGTPAISMPLLSAALAGKNEEAEEQDKKLIADAIELYLKDIAPPQREQKTYDEYRLVLRTFRDTCKKRYLQEISRNDCLEFMRHLYSIGNEARTVFNRMGIVEQLLKRNGIASLLQKGDKPKWVAGLREMYQPEDLQALFKACTPDEKVLYMFFLFTGERDKEVRYTSWDDIDFVRKRVRVTAKKRLGFKPKDKEEREIPVVSLLMQALEEYKARQTSPNAHNLVFPTANGRADRKFENKLKRIARRAGLNCGRCISRFENKCSEGPHCSKWGLHKFRHTFATTSLENGVSIRTLQEWLGHSDLESTMVYLKFVQRKDIQELLDNSELAGLAARTLASQEIAIATEPPV